MILIIRTFVVAQQVKHSIPLSAIGGSKSVIGNFCFLSTVLKKAKMRNKSPEWPNKNHNCDAHNSSLSLRFEFQVKN